MPKVVIVGELYEQNVQIGGGPMPGGGGPVDPGYGRPGWSPADPGYGQGHPGGHPGNRPPGSWSGEYPSGGPVYPGGPTDPGWGVGGVGGGHPSGQPIVPPQGGTDVPADEYAPLPPPEDIYSQYVVSVWNPKTASWTTKSYPPR